MICKNLQECIDEKLFGVQLEKCDNKNMNVCIESSDNRKAVKCAEHNKKYIYENSRRNHVISYSMDGGIIVEDRTVPPNTSKCDYLFVINDTELTAILIELKGVKCRSH